ncbi:MAG: hypothetical protein MK052_02775 [Alphaproteobacteria bacterium]|nr:hypothetical protein [Alphaproteobacteria bacterium]
MPENTTVLAPATRIDRRHFLHGLKIEFSFSDASDYNADAGFFVFKQSNGRNFLVNIK